MIRFVQRPTGEIFRVLQEVDNGMWLISYDIPAAPFFAASAETEGVERIETPSLFLAARQRSMTPAERKRLTLIQPCGNGVIEDDAQERWSTDYRAQAVLDLDEFTAIVIHQNQRVRTRVRVQPFKSAVLRYIKARLVSYLIHRGTVLNRLPQIVPPPMQLFRSG